MVVLIYNINRLSTVIVTLQRFQGGRGTTISLSTPASEIENIRFYFWGPTSSTVTSAVQKVIGIWFVYKIELIITGIILDIIIYRLFKQLNKFKTVHKKVSNLHLKLSTEIKKLLNVLLDTFPGQIMNFHICSDKLNERMEVTGVIRPCLNIRWDVKFLKNLKQINCCSTLKGKYTLSYILAHRLRQVLGQTFLRGCYPVIMNQNLYYYVKLICETSHGSCKFINPLILGREKIN